MTDCVAMSSRRLGSRSASAPAGNDRNSTGANCSVPTRPSRKGESVSSRTSQDWATDCIQVPTSETSWPAKKSRKSRCAKARSAAGRLEGAASGTRPVYFCFRAIARASSLFVIRVVPRTPRRRARRASSSAVCP